MKVKIIVISIVILIVVFLVFVNKKKLEHLTSDEAIKNVASIYNTDVMTIKNLNVTGALNILPKGIITMWSGTTPPDGWTLCNGQNGTPNLQGRFVLGVGNNYTIGSTGGEASHVLTTNEIPTHSHPIDDYYYAEKQDSCGGNKGVFGSSSSDRDNCSLSIYHRTQNEGGNQAHNIMPPYYVLAYIIKL